MLKLAACKGHARSLHALAEAYLDPGKDGGVPKDSKEATRLFELGAATDHVPCKTSLAKLCIDGDGLPQDRVRAAKLLGLDRTADLLSKGFNPPDFLFKGTASVEESHIPDNEYTEEEMDEFFSGADDTFEPLVMGPTDTKRGADAMAAAFAASMAGRRGREDDDDDDSP
mmetsp:Transcript_4275/g.13331  ORF Transcript_4275/g.13331 Transcript_4275/m.13331 type:complete len:170 (+) Transcript_4275:573-1082(+)